MEPDGDGPVPDERPAGMDLDVDEFVPSLEGRSGRFALGVAVLAAVGMTVGSGITVVSAEGFSTRSGSRDSRSARPCSLLSPRSRNWR